MSFDSTVNSSSGETNSLDITGNAEVNDSVGGDDALSSLSVSGSTTIDAASETFRCVFRVDNVEGELPHGVGAKDLILGIIGEIGVAGGTGHVGPGGLDGEGDRAVLAEGCRPADLGLPEERMFYCGMALGYADPDHPINYHHSGETRSWKAKSRFAIFS